MKYFFPVILTLLFLSSCKHDKKILVDTVYMDSLLTHYAMPAAQKVNAQDIQFWAQRIDPVNTGITNESKYAAALTTRFNLLGNINDVLIADSILRKVDSAYGHKEANPVMAMCRHAILMHRFKTADSLLAEAGKIGIKPSESLALSFDVDFELGRTELAKTELKRLEPGNDYGFYFRNAKMAHYNGDIDAALLAMKKAVTMAENDPYLQQAALSNLADLYLHSGDLQNAYDCYRTSVNISTADLHSIMGIGWIALVHDNNDTVAEKIFQFVHTQTLAPDPLYKLAQTFVVQKDTVKAIQYARLFEQQVTRPVYGNMYNKYLIELYTGMLHEPAKAELLAERETGNRATPQTYAWYAWTLLMNNKPGKAYEVYRQFVSGKPLEGLELYWMGKLMQGLKKGYNARQFFTAALKNKYDLSPGNVADAEKAMEE